MAPEIAERAERRVSADIAVWSRFGFVCGDRCEGTMPGDSEPAPAM